MYRIAAAVLLLLPAPSFADVAMPGFSRVSKEVVLHFPEDTDDLRFFLVSNNGVESLPITPGQPVHINGDRRQGSGRVVSVYAVPGQLLHGVRGVPDRGWFTEAESKGVGVRQATIDFYAAVPFFDPRDRIVQTYKVNLDDGKISLALIEDTGRFPWPACGIITALGLVWFGVWVMRRRARSLSRSLPNPQTNQPQRPAGVEGQQEQG